MADQNRPLTWMLVEDDTAIRNVIETMCELWDIKTISFKDGFEASEYLAKSTLPDPIPQVALLDIRMPGPWGHEIGAKIRSHEVLRNIGVILMTAYELPGEDEQEYLQVSGADTLLYKPLPPMEELHHIINQILEKRKTLAAD